MDLSSLTAVIGLQPITLAPLNRNRLLNSDGTENRTIRGQADVARRIKDNSRCGRRRGSAGPRCRTLADAIQHGLGRGRLGPMGGELRARDPAAGLVEPSRPRRAGARSTIAPAHHGWPPMPQP
jgi:hypothetical protein